MSETRKCGACGWPDAHAGWCPVERDRLAALTDDEFWDEAVTGRAQWLLYGDLDEHFAAFVAKVFTRDFGEWAFTPRPLEQETRDFQVAYWLFLSILVAADFAEYGTSPRGAWLTPDGERFKRIFTAKYATDPNFDWQPNLGA